MKEPLILTIDVGTQSVRVALFNKSGDTIGIVKRAYNPPYISKQEGMAEQDPDFYFKNICAAAKELKKDYGNRFADIIGVAMDTVRDTSVILDENFKIVISKNKINVLNYIELDDFSNLEIKIKYIDGLVLITGKDLIIKKILNDELQIEGNIIKLELR